MDQWLANIYGTGGGEDLEKTAQAVMLQKLAEEEGVDISGLDEEQLEALAQEVLGGEGDVVEDGGIDPNEVEQPVITEEQLAKEAQAKFEEADFLGRVMAHAYTQELEKIGGVKDVARRAGGAISRGAKSVGRAFRGDTLREGVKKYRSMGRLEGKAKKHMSAGGGMNNRSMIEEGRKLKDRASHAKGQARNMALRGAAKSGLAYGGAGAAAYGAKKGLEKDASATAFEKLAFDHAGQILGAAEQTLQQGQQSPFLMQQAPQIQYPEQATPQFAQALDERALEILAENGYDVDAIVGTLGGEGEGDQTGEPVEGDVQQ